MQLETNIKTMTENINSLPADAEEMLPLVDNNGKIIGKALRSECHKDKKLVHPVVHVHVYNNEGKIFLQKRSINKKIQPGKWDTSVGGHIAYGESVETALKREAWEEAGIENGFFEKITQYVWQSEIETELVYVYKCCYRNPKIIAVAEIDEAKFWTLSEIDAAMGKNIFTPMFEHEFVKIKNFI